MARFLGRRSRAVLPTLAVAVLALLATAVPVVASVPVVGGSWRAAPSFPSAVTALSVVAGRDGRLYLFGTCTGRCAQANGSVGDGATVLEVYDPSARVWRPGAHPPAICGSSASDLAPQASALDGAGNIELAGCWDTTDTSGTSTTGPRIAIYHPATRSWTLQPGRAPWADPLAGAMGPGGRVLWFSAILRVSDGAVFRTGYRVLEDRAGTWTAGRSMGGHAPSDAAVAGPDGRLYVLGADRDCRSEFGSCPAAPVKAYSPLANTWTSVTTLPVARAQLAAAVDRHGRIFVLGGLTPDGSGLVRTVDVYAPATNRWARAASLPAGRFEALAAATPDGRIWLLAGYDAGGNPLTTMTVFTPAS